MEPQPPQFRINAKNFFLTYAQCPVEPVTILEHIEGLEGDRIEWAVCAREKHQDGNYHLHVQMQFHTARNIRNARHFDMGEYHPNISGTRNLKKV